MLIVDEVRARHVVVHDGTTVGKLVGRLAVGAVALAALLVVLWDERALFLVIAMHTRALSDEERAQLADVRFRDAPYLARF